MLRLAINCRAVRGVLPGWCISHAGYTRHGAPPKGFESVGTSELPRRQGFGLRPKRLDAPKGAERSKCGAAGHMLRLAINCRAVRGVLPG